MMTGSTVKGKRVGSKGRVGSGSVKKVLVRRGVQVLITPRGLRDYRSCSAALETRGMDPLAGELSSVSLRI